MRLAGCTASQEIKSRSSGAIESSVGRGIRWWRRGILEVRGRRLDVRGERGGSDAGGQAGLGGACVGGLHAGLCGSAEAVVSVFRAGADEGGEERVRGEGLGLELGMELAAHEPRMIGDFDDFDVHAIGSFSGDAETGAG